MYSIVFDNTEYTELPYVKNFTSFYEAVKLSIRNVNNEVWQRAVIRSNIRGLCTGSVTEITPGCKATTWYINKDHE